MDIKVNNKYAITSDERNIILNTIHVAESGKRAGKVYYKAISYHGTLKQALAALREHGIKSSDAQSLESLIEDVAKINQEIAAL